MHHAQCGAQAQLAIVNTGFFSSFGPGFSPTMEADFQYAILLERIFKNKSFRIFVVIYGCFFVCFLWPAFFCGLPGILIHTFFLLLLCLLLFKHLQVPRKLIFCGHPYFDPTRRNMQKYIIFVLKLFFMQADFRVFFLLLQSLVYPAY